MLKDKARMAMAYPVESCLRLWSAFREWPERYAARCDYDVAANWEDILHQRCGAQPFADVEVIWTSIRNKLNSRGIDLGPGSYSGHNDGDRAFIRAINYLVHHLRPHQVVETGVGHGVTSRFVLEAFRHQGFGHLWSVDMPPLTAPEVHDQIGIVVDDDLKTSWTYIQGSSRRHLRSLLEQTPMIDLFIHDSWHSEYNIQFELQTAWPYIRPGGAMVVDDIDLNWAFYKFAKSVPDHLSLVCAAEPVRPDAWRVQHNHPGLFGIVVKNA